MASIREYHRPASIEEAVALLTRPGVESVIMGGGTAVNADPTNDPVEVVDLQALSLDGVSSTEGTVRIGATTRLQDVVDAEAVPPLIRGAAKREAPNTIRNAATIGGAVAGGDPESGLVAALLVHGATVEVIGGTGSMTAGVADLLADRSLLDGSIIGAVAVEAGGESAWAATGRTPADTPIVSVYGRSHGAATRLALTGVATTPILIDPDRVGELDPLGDFRGSPEYRRALAVILTARVLASLGGAE